MKVQVRDSGTPSPAARPCRRHRPMGRCWVRPAGMPAGLVEATYAGGESASGPALTAHSESLTHGPQCSRRPAPVSPTELGAPAFSWPPDAICVQISLEKNSPKVPPPPRYHSPRGTPTLPAKVQGGVVGGDHLAGQRSKVGCGPGTLRSHLAGYHDKVPSGRPTFPVQRAFTTGSGC